MAQTDLFGELEYDWRKVKLDYVPGSHWRVEWNGHSVNLSGKRRPSASDMASAIDGYEQGYAMGVAVGNRQKASQIRQVLENYLTRVPGRALFVAGHSASDIGDRHENPPQHPQEGRQVQDHPQGRG